MKIRRLLFMGMLLLGAFSLAACDLLSADGEASEPVADEAGEGFDFSADEAEDPDQDPPSGDGEPMDFDPEEVDNFDFGLCISLADHVPCGTYTVDPTAGSMTCDGQSLALADSPQEFLTLIPANEDGSQLFARATGSGEGTLKLTEKHNEGATYEGVLTNSAGQPIHYTLNHVSDSGYIFGSFGGDISPPGVNTTCSFTRAYDGFFVEE